jgi:zinc protease
MSKKSVTNTKIPPTIRLRKRKTVGEIHEYLLEPNGLRVLFAPRRGTGVVTSDIVYFVGSRDEARGETGLAHMFEHMLFKPTLRDLKSGTESGAMRFERETGIVLNANTWKDRTSYYFSYPTHYFERALAIEAERMHSVTLTDSEFQPERSNVLSEYDMYAGGEEFALETDMWGTAFQSHPYRHGTIGYREDIESYTTEKLERFYRAHYTPENAALIIVGDVSEAVMKRGVMQYFGPLPRSRTFTPRSVYREPKQEGVRIVTVERPSTKHILALGMKHPGFPTVGWFETLVALDLLAQGEDSILSKALVDPGHVTSIASSLEPCREMGLATLFFTLPKADSHDRIKSRVHDCIRALTPAAIKPYLKKTLAKVLLDEALERENSLAFTSTLVEYVSSGSWEAFYDTEKIIRGITAHDVHARITALMDPKNMTLGVFRGTRTLS